MPELPTIRVANADIRIQTAGIAVLATIAAGATLKWLSPVLVPFILAVFFVCGIAPIIDYFQRRLGVSRLVGAAITFLLGLIVLVLFWLFIWISVASLIDQAPKYKARLTEFIDRGAQMLPMQQVSLFTNGGLLAPAPTDEDADSSDQPLVDDDASSTKPAASGKTDAEKAGAEQAGAGEREADSSNGEPSALQNGNEPVTVGEGPMQDENPESISESIDLGGQSAKYFMTYVTRLSEGLPTLLGSAVMMMIFMFFLLLGDAQLGIERPKIWDEIESKIRNYIVTKTLISLATGAAVTIVLWLFGIPLALVFGLLAFLLNFIPNVGPLIMCVLPLPLILLDPDLGIVGMIAVIALTSGIQFVSGNVIETKIMGDSFELHPVVVLLTLMLWGMIWDLPGMFLATPITAAIKILLEKFEYTRPVAEMMAGRFDSLSKLIGDDSTEDDAESAVT